MNVQEFYKKYKIDIINVDSPYPTEYIKHLYGVVPSQEELNILQSNGYLGTPKKLAKKLLELNVEMEICKKMPKQIRYLINALKYLSDEFVLYDSELSQKYSILPNKELSYYYYKTKYPNFYVRLDPVQAFTLFNDQMQHARSYNSLKNWIKNNAPICASLDKDYVVLSNITDSPITYSEVKSLDYVKKNDPLMPLLCSDICPRIWYIDPNIPSEVLNELYYL